MRRFFADTSNDHVIITGSDAHHITDVLRLKEGDEVIVCSGDGYDCVTKLTSFSKEEVCGEILSRVPSSGEPAVSIKIFQCLPKGDKFELIIQKAVELGVSGIVPVMSRRCVTKLTSDKAKSKTERWNKIAESAAKQSGRGLIPTVFPPVSFNDAVDMMMQVDLSVVAYELEQERSLKDLLETHPEIKSVNVFIGPEGGIDDEEILKLKKAGAISVSLGQRILRTETAPLAVISNIIYHYE